MLEAGRYGGPLRDHERQVTDHPGVRRYLTDLEEKRAPYGLWSLVQREDLHAHDIGHHGDEKSERDPDLIVFEGPEGALGCRAGPRAAGDLSTSCFATLWRLAVASSDAFADPLNPQRWSLRKRVAQTLLLGLSTLVVTFASSVFSSGTGQIAAEFGISSVVATLTTSLFVLGCASRLLLARLIEQTRSGR